MNKKWVDLVKEKLDAPRVIKNEIDNLLGDLLNELENSTHEISCESKITDEKNLIWSVIIGGRIFSITWDEIFNNQKIIEKDVDENYNPIETVKKQSTKEALRKLILEKI